MQKVSSTKRMAWIIVFILSISAALIYTNVRMVYNVTSSQINDIGRLQMESIRGQLQQSLTTAEYTTLKIAKETDLLMQSGASMKELEDYYYNKKSQLADDSCINVYIASIGWDIIPNFERPNNFDVTTRPWYIGARANPGEVYITQPYLDLASGTVCYSVSCLLSDGVTAVCSDYSLVPFQDYISEMSMNGDRQALIVTESGEIAGYTDSSYVGANINDALPEYADILALEKNNEHLVILPQTINGHQQTVFCSKTENNWYLILCVENAVLYSSSYHQLLWICLVTAVLIGSMVLLYLITVRSRRRVEVALSVREEFISHMSEQFRGPIGQILTRSNPETLIDSDNFKEDVEKIREAGLRLSTMVDNLLSYSNINVSSKDNSSQERQNLSNVNTRIRTIIVSVLFVAMCVSVYLFSTANIKLGNDEIRQQSNNYEYELAEWISEQKSILSMFSSMIASNPALLDDYESAVSYLNDITIRYSDISVTYMTNPEFEHTVIMNNGWEPDSDWHVEERQWYIDTMNSPDGFNISSPYYDEQTGLYCVTFSQSVYDNDGNFLGNFGIDFYMDKLVQILGESYTDTGYAFLVDAEGKIINHPNIIYQMSQDGSTNALDLNYRNAYADNQRISFFKDYDGNRVACISKKNDDSNFTVMIVRNWWSIYGSIIMYSLIFVAVFGACVYAVYYLISRLMQWQEEVNHKLKEAADRATAAGEAKSRFLAQMSHEIRTPINAVLGMNEMILRESDSQEILEYSSDIQSAGRTLLSLINSILDFSKIEDGSMEIVPVNYDTSSLINDLVNMTAERAAKRDLELKLDIAEDLPCLLHGDDVRLRQIITNLLTNSVKYTETGSVTLSIHGTVSDDKKYIILHVAVKDTGIGIREEDMPKLFQSFQRLDQERNHNIEGTGLGLSIVQKLLNMMDTQLNVESVYGQGSCFFFDLTQDIVDATPIGNYAERRSAALASAAKESQTYLYAPKAKILVVDDNEMNLKVVRGLLKRNGIIPETVTSGVQCIDKVSNQSYDIIFLDHMMPGMDGIETLQRLKDGHLLPDNTIVVALTANAIVGVREEYLAKGFDAYLSKPVSVDKLEQTLASYLPKDIISYVNKDLSTPTETVNRTPEAADKPAPIAPTATPENGDEAVEVHYINLATGMNYCAGDREMYEEVATVYLEEGPENFEKLDQFFESQDWKNYAIVAHAVKSTSLTIGAEGLSEIAKSHEFAAKEGRAEDIESTYIDFLTLYQDVLSELKQLLENGIPE